MNEKIELISNPMLIGAIELVKKNQTPESQRVFLDELSHAKLISPVIVISSVMDENGEEKPTEGEKMTIPMFPGSDNKEYLMTFTDINEIKKLNITGPVKVWSFNIMDYARMMSSDQNKCDGIVINPISNGPIVKKELIAQIVEKNKKD